MAMEQMLIATGLNYVHIYQRTTIIYLEQATTDSQAWWSWTDLRLVQLHHIWGLASRTAKVRDPYAGDGTTDYGRVVDPEYPDFAFRHE